jgi:hypothetical protein
MEENLIGYLIDALDPETRAEVETQLEADPEARARLELLRAGLAPLRADAEPPAPPPGLVIATLARVAAFHTQGRRKSAALPPGPPLLISESGGPVPHRGGSWFRRPDWLVAAVLLFLVGGLATTALVRYWRESQQLACANNLRVLWEGLQGYSDQNEGRFPQTDKDGPRSVAGIFVPVLREAGFSIPETTLVCPAEGGPPPRVVTLAELERLYRTDTARFRVTASDLAGCYAYSLGYAEGPTYYGPCREMGDNMPLLADRPRPDGLFPPPGNSLNHGGAGQNVLHIGGNVRWCQERTVGPGGDDIYLNRNQEVRAGLDCQDAVLGASIATPGME